jgi:hypothetical protein
VVNVLVSEKQNYTREEREVIESSPNLPLVFELTVSRRGTRIGSEGSDNKPRNESR